VRGMTRWIGLLIGAALLGCVEVSGTVTLPVTRTAALWSCPREKSLSLGANERLSQVVDLDLFSSFSASTTIEDAEARYGKPQALFRGLDHARWRYARYRMPDAFVEVAYEPGGSSCAAYHRGHSTRIH